MIGTSCRFCEFRTNDEKGHQNGCELDLIPLYEAKYKGTENEVEHHVIDDERGHDEFKVLPTLCLFRRPPGWKEAKKGLLVDGKTFGQVARDELTLKVTAVVFLDKDQTMQDLLKTIDDLSNMSKPPSKLVIVNWSDHVRPHQFLSLHNRVTLPWMMETVLEQRDSIPEYAYEGGGQRRAFDLGSKKVDTPFFMTIRVGDTVPPDFIKELEEDIIDKMQGVIMHESDNTPSFYQASVYRLVGANKQRPVGDKIRKIAEEQECTNLIKHP
jgi:hypothetical protein